MKREKVVRKRVITRNGQVIAKASSVVIVSDDQAESYTTYQQSVEVESSPNHAYSSAHSHVSSYSHEME